MAEWWISTPSTKRACMIEMPALDPMLRMRVNRPAPWVRYSGLTVAKAMVLSGTKIRPVPIPDRKPDMMISRVSMPRLNWLICQVATALAVRPTSRISLVLTLPISCPTRNMAMNDPTPRGMVTMPVKATG